MTKLNIAAGNSRFFWCPGCDSAHHIDVRAGGWTCDDDIEHPPSSRPYSCTRTAR